MRQTKLRYQFYLKLIFLEAERELILRLTYHDQFSLKTCQKYLLEIVRLGFIIRRLKSFVGPDFSSGIFFSFY